MKVQQKHSSYYTGYRSEQGLITDCCVLLITVNMEKHQNTSKTWSTSLAEDSTDMPMTTFVNVTQMQSNLKYLSPTP